MKVLSLLLATIFLRTAVALSQGETRVSVDFFHDNLEAYGDWREIGDLGYCWQPRDVDRGWRPYSDGRWLYTDAGWTWNSEEPYSWAVYHYGRWARIDGVGWVWVPGTEWGPAWVSWRSGASQVGWAPLPPDAPFDRSVGFDARVDAEYDMGPANYNFVDVRNFGAPNLRTVLIDPQENLTIFSQSTNITKITYVNNTVYNGGPQYDVISRQSAQPIPQLKLERQQGLGGAASAAHSEQLQSRVVGGSLRVVAIPFDARPATAPRKVAAKVGTPALDRGWNNAGPPAEVAKVRARIKVDAAKPVGPRGSTAVVQAPAASPVSNKTLPKKTATADEPATTSRPAKPANAEASNPRPAPPANEEIVPGSPSKKGVVKGGETPHPAVATLPDGVKKERTLRTDVAERAPNERPAPVATPLAKIHPAKGDAPPKPERAAAPITERNIPNVPEPHPQAKKPEPHEPVAPTASQPQPAKAKSKDKGKEENKDASKPAGPPQ